MPLAIRVSLLESNVPYGIVRSHENFQGVQSKQVLCVMFCVTLSG